MIPEEFKMHSATITPMQPTGTFGTPFTVDCFAELVTETHDQVDGVIEHNGQLFCDPGTAIPVGSTVAVRGYTATVIESESWDDGSFGLAHRKVEWSTRPMPLQVTVERYTGEGDFDEVNNKHVENWTLLYTGAGRIAQGPGFDNRTQDMAEQSVDYDRVKVSLPWDSPALFASDRVTVTSGNDTHLTGVVAVIDSSAQDAPGAERRYIARINRG